MLFSSSDRVIKIWLGKNEGSKDEKGLYKPNSELATSTFHIRLKENMELMCIWFSSYADES